MGKDITVKNVKKKFKDTVAVNNVSLNIRSSELYGFIGPDGAGKTTLLRMITTLLLPDQGKIWIGNHNVVNDYRKIRTITGYMPGRFSLYGDLSVRENLEFYAAVFQVSVKDHYSLIEPVYKMLEPFEYRLARNLSGGMKQKLALSCALIHKPEILVLDEPTTGVDAVSRKEFWELLSQLKSKDITVLVSTPYMDEASLCDRVSLFYKGRLLLSGKPDDINNQFAETIYSIRSSNMYELLSRVREFSGCRSAHLFGQTAHVILKHNYGKKNLDEYLKKQSLNFSINRVEAGIEDVFLKSIEN